MADIIFSSFSQAQLEQAIYKINGIEKNLLEINNALDYILAIKEDISKLSNGELVKKNNENLQGTGIIEDDTHIFFPKDGRFPSGSIDVGPGATISENGGWLQYKTNTLGKSYILLDYELTQGGTTKPVYWERLMEEQDVIIQPINSVVMDVERIEIVPSSNYQINQLKLDFVEPVENLVIQIKSLDTNKVIKYFPNENAFKTGSGGFDFGIGSNNIIDGFTSTPLSVLTAYNLEITFSKPVKLKGNGVLPWFSVNRQIINKIDIMVEGDKFGAILSRRHSTTQSLAKDVKTKVMFDTEDTRFINNLSKIGLTYSNGRFTATENGIYHVSSMLQWDSNASGVRGIYLMLNGSNIKVKKDNPNGTMYYSTISDTIKLNVGDYIEIHAMQTAVAVLNIGSGETDIPIGYGILFKVLRLG